MFLANLVKLGDPRNRFNRPDKRVERMATVKGSKQHQMVVVPHRPWLRASVWMLFLVIAAGIAWATYFYGLSMGIATRVEVIEERDAIRTQLAQSLVLIEDQRQEIADLKVGNEIDTRATEEVQQTVEQLQDRIAQLNEEIGFYKGVMVPNADDKGLRIERLNVRGAGDGSQFRYSLLLTQVVDKHDFIQGGVTIQVEGRQDEIETALPLEQISDADGSIRFRFRYFQNIDGELTIPEGFEPRAVTVVAQSTGRGGQRLEKSFDWEG